MSYEEEFEEWWRAAGYWGLMSACYLPAKSAYLAGRQKGEEERERLRQAIEESLADNLPYLTEQRLKKALEP